MKDFAQLTPKDIVLEQNVKQIGAEVQELMTDIPDSHGWVHSKTVANITAFLSGDPKLGWITGVLHDLRYWESGDRIARGIDARPARGRDKKHASEYVDRLLNESLITGEQREDMLRAMQLHSKPPRELEDRSLLLVALQEADMLSRLNLTGIKQTLEANQGYKVLLYEEGKPVKRDFAPRGEDIKFGDIKSAVDDLRSEVDWASPNEDYMQSEAGRALAAHLVQMPQQFLATMEEVFEDVDGARLKQDYDVWIAWLDTILESQKVERTAADESADRGEFQEYMRVTVTLEDPSLLTVGSFRQFYQGYQAQLGTQTS